MRPMEDLEESHVYSQPITKGRPGYHETVEKSPCKSAAEARSSPGQYQPICFSSHKPT